MQKRILVIEDDADTCVILEKILDRAGYAVEVLTDGRAIVNGQFQVPDLFILDNRLPTIEGLAICKYLRLQSSTKHTPIIIISGADQIAGKTNPAGANHFIPKPVSAADLLKVVQLFLHPQLAAGDSSE